MKGKRWKMKQRRGGLGGKRWKMKQRRGRIGCVGEDVSEREHGVFVVTVGTYHMFREMCC